MGFFERVLVDSTFNLSTQTCVLEGFKVQLPFPDSMGKGSTHFGLNVWSLGFLEGFERVQSSLNLWVRSNTLNIQASWNGYV